MRHPNRDVKEQDGYKYLDLRTEAVIIHLCVLGLKMDFKVMGTGKLASGQSIAWSKHP